MTAAFLQRLRLSSLLRDYGMVLVLILLCGLFSAATLTDQAVSAEAAARQLTRQILRELPRTARILVASPAQGDEVLFADQLTQQLASAGLTVTQVVKGEPKDARQALEKLAQTNQPLHAIAASESASTWLVFADLKTSFPSLGEPRLLKPTRQRWPSFLNRENLLNIMNQIAVIAILAVGMTFVIIAGGIDLSVGSLIALSAVSTCLLISRWAGALEASTAGMIVSSFGGILITSLIGAFSGAVIAAFRIPPFIVTLGVMLMASGLAYLLSGGQSVYQVPESFVWLGRGTVAFGLPNAVVLMLILYVAAHVMMARTKLGRYLYAVGGNAEAARLSGVPVRRVQLIAYTLCGLLSGLGGVVLASQLKSGSPMFGQMYELYVIAAVVVGGASLQGGEGRMFGTLIGALIIAVIQNGMNLTNIESYTQKVVLGFVILGAVFLDQLRQRNWPSR